LCICFISIAYSCAGEGKTGSLACSISFVGAVLHMRGDECATQPLAAANGDTLLWNGEVFGGLHVPANTSDTVVVLQALSNAALEGPARVAALMASIEVCLFLRMQTIPC
jgi:hypothetical protein